MRSSTEFGVFSIEFAMSDLFIQQPFVIFHTPRANSKGLVLKCVGQVFWAPGGTKFGGLGTF